MKKDEPALLAKVNETLLAMDKAGEIDQLWAKWLGPDTEYKMTRDDKVDAAGGAEVHAAALSSTVDVSSALGAILAEPPAKTRGQP